MRRNRTLGLLATLSAFGGCDAPDELANPRVTVRDSAEIQLVETASDRLPATWALDSVPSLSVGEIDGHPAYLFTRVAGAFQFPDGRLAIANGGTNEIRFYGTDGQHLLTVGRSGEGPGEYQYLRGIARCRADGFIAFDLNWQLNAYDLDGRFVDRSVLRTPTGPPPYELACDEHGHIAVIGWGEEASGNREVGYYSATDRLLWIDPDGAIRADLGEWLVSERLGTTGGSRPHPAGRGVKFVLWDELVWAGTGESFEISGRRLSDGRLVRVLRGPSELAPVTEGVRTSVLERRLADLPAERHASFRSDFAEWEWPATLPAFDALQVDSEGVLWARGFRADPDASEVWSLLDVEEGYLGDLTLEPRHVLLEAGADYVLVLVRDQFDVERVERYGLRRGL